MEKSDKGHLLLFGASGAIGSAIYQNFKEKGWEVVGVSRTVLHDSYDKDLIMSSDPLDSGFDSSIFDKYAPYNAVIWAQGANLNDSVYTVESSANLELYKANCLYIVITLRILLERRLLAPSARMCVISSIWQSLARQNKLSYGMTKAALQGLIMSAAADLGKDGYVINAVLPGALDTPMTRQNLSHNQLEKLQSATLFGRLPTLNEVAALTYFLCSEDNSGITGQSIAVDLGFSHVRIL